MVSPQRKKKQGKDGQAGGIEGPSGAIECVALIQEITLCAPGKLPVVLARTALVCAGGQGERKSEGEGEGGVVHLV